MSLFVPNSTLYERNIVAPGVSRRAVTNLNFNFEEPIYKPPPLWDTSSSSIRETLKTILGGIALYAGKKQNTKFEQQQAEKVYQKTIRLVEELLQETKMTFFYERRNGLEADIKIIQNVLKCLYRRGRDCLDMLKIIAQL